MSETTNLKLFKHDNPSTNENQFDVTKALNNNWDKLDKFAGTTNTNINTLQEKDKEFEQDINDIQDKNTEQDDEIEALQKKNEELKAENERLNQDLNALPSNTAEGEYITLTDSADSRFNKFRVIGKSEQKTRSGKNKFNVNMVSISTATDKVFTTSSFVVTDKWSQVLIYNENLIKMLEPNKNYKMIADVTLLEKTSDVSNGYNNANLLTLYDGTNTITVLKTSTTTEKNNWTINEKKHLITEFTTPADLTGYGMRCYCYYTNNAGAGKFKYDNVMILDATEEDETFEMYGVSPSPEFKSDIQNVTADVEMTICNNNLTNTDILASLKNSAVTINSKSSFTIDLSKGNVSAFQNIDLLFGKNDKNKRYTLSYHLHQNNDSFRPSFAIIYSDGTKTGGGNSGGTDVDVTLNSTEGKTIERISIGWITQTGGGVATLSDIYLRLTDDTSEFKEQENQEFVFPLQEGQKLFEGSYLANDGIHHKRKQIELDENTGFFLSTLNDYQWFGVNIVGVKKGSILTCNYLQNYVRIGNYVGISNSNASDRIYIAISKEITTLEQLKTWLRERKAEGNPVIVEYDLKEEEIEAYTPEQQKVYNEIVNTAKTYKTVTNIFSTNEISPKFEVEYRQDIKSLINNVSQAVLNNA